MGWEWRNSAPLNTVLPLLSNFWSALIAYKHECMHARMYACTNECIRKISACLIQLNPFYGAPSVCTPCQVYARRAKWVHAVPSACRAEPNRPDTRDCERMRLSKKMRTIISVQFSSVLYYPGIASPVALSPPARRTILTIIELCYSYTDRICYLNSKMRKKKWISDVYTF